LPDELKTFTPICQDIFQLDNKNELAEINNQIYDTQRRIGIYILYLVAAITFCGLGLSALQLYWGYEAARLNRRTARPTESSPPNGTSPEAPGVTHATFSKDGFEISSSVAGLIILAFSLAFFIIYVWKVYPIQSTS
jgi:hypothetical protein